MLVILEKKHHRYSRPKRSSTEVPMEGHDTEVEFTLPGELTPIVPSARSLIAIVRRHGGLRHPDLPIIARNTLRRGNPIRVGSRTNTANLHRAPNVRYAYCSTRLFGISRRCNRWSANSLGHRCSASVYRRQSRQSQRAFGGYKYSRIA